MERGQPSEAIAHPLYQTPLVSEYCMVQCVVNIYKYRGFVSFGYIIQFINSHQTLFLLDLIDCNRLKSNFKIKNLTKIYLFYEANISM